MHVSNGLFVVKNKLLLFLGYLKKGGIDKRGLEKDDFLYKGEEGKGGGGGEKEEGERRREEERRGGGGGRGGRGGGWEMGFDFQV